MNLSGSHILCGFSSLMSNSQVKCGHVEHVGDHGQRKRRGELGHEIEILTLCADLGDPHADGGGVLSFASANRDESAFDNPDTFDPLRSNVRTHLAFGHGIHSCIGAALARLEGRLALARIAEQVKSIDILDPQLQYTPSFLMRGLQRLPVRMTAENR